MFRMKTNHTEENKIWAVIKTLSIIIIIVAMLLFSIFLVSGKKDKQNKELYKIELGRIKYVENKINEKLYTCNIDPDEQYYLKYFMEGDKVTKEYLNDFHKFCLDEFPAIKYFGNNLSKNDTTILWGLENGTEYIVPKGELWTITYIGGTSPYFNILPMPENNTELSEIQKIELIAQGIAKSHKYKINEFDCTDFTKSLVGNLTKEGYDARCIIGYKKQNPKQVFHAWTEVNLSGEIIWIESTNGEIVTEENKPYYKTLKGYKKYQCW